MQARKVHFHPANQDDEVGCHPLVLFLSSLPRSQGCACGQNDSWGQRLGGGMGGNMCEHQWGLGRQTLAL